MSSNLVVMASNLNSPNSSLEASCSTLHHVGQQCAPASDTHRRITRKSKSKINRPMLQLGGHYIIEKRKNPQACCNLPTYRNILATTCNCLKHASQWNCECTVQNYLAWASCWERSVSSFCNSASFDEACSCCVCLLMLPSCFLWIHFFRCILECEQDCTSTASRGKQPQASARNSSWSFFFEAAHWPNILLSPPATSMWYKASFSSCNFGTFCSIFWIPNWVWS